MAEMRTARAYWLAGASRERGIHGLRAFRRTLQYARRERERHR